MKGSHFLLVILSNLLIFCAQADHALPIIFFQSSFEGLFTIYQQAKIMQAVCELFGCALNIIPVHSEHGYDVCLCELFEMPENVECGGIEMNGKDSRNHRHNFLRCSTDFTELDLLGYDDVCLVTDPNHLGLTGARQLISQSNPDFLTEDSLSTLPMIVKEQYVQYANKIRTALGIIHSDNFQTRSKDFRSHTVVHWRRGDQLNTRCLAADRSVNCDSAEALIEQVRAATTDSIIYVATNESPDSPSHDIFNKAGMVTYVNLMADWPADDDVAQLDTLSVLMLETVLMLEATTFLAWGISAVSGIVEYERMVHGRSYCLLSDVTEGDRFCKRFAPPAKPPIPDAGYEIDFTDATLYQYCKVYPEDCKPSLDENSFLVMTPFQLIQHRPPSLSHSQERDGRI